MKKFKLPILYLMALLSSILPVLIYFIINYDGYVTTKGQGVRLLFGGTLALVILIIKTLGFLKVKSSVMIFLFAFIFAYLFESIISDILIFSFLALVGEIGSFIVRIFINKEKENRAHKKCEDAIEKAILKTNGRV